MTPFPFEWDEDARRLASARSGLHQLVKQMRERSRRGAGEQAHQEALAVQMPVEDGVP